MFNVAEIPLMEDRLLNKMQSYHWKYLFHLKLHIENALN